MPQTQKPGWRRVELPSEKDAVAPDQSEVRLLAQATRGSMAHFRLLPGQVSKAVAHRTIEELWFVVSGEGEMWLKLGVDQESEEYLKPGVSIFLPVGVHFQFRNSGDQPLDIVGVTLPPWPGDDEAYFVAGKW